jgi:hypothetical protein
MRRTILGAAAATMLLALPAGAMAHGNGHGWNKSRWDARAVIKPVAPGEDASGRAFLRQRPGKATVVLRVGKLEPDARYAVRVQQGCEPTGATVLALPDLYTDERGVARMWLTLPTGDGVNVAQLGYAVNVLGYDATGAVVNTVTCGAVDAPKGKAKARVHPTVPGGPEGTVNAVQEGGLLRVEIHLKGLAPGSTHAQHIHLGSCKAGGDVVVPFADAVAGPDGQYHAIQTIAAAGANVVRGGVYYQIHEAATPTVGRGIACGDLRSKGWRGHGAWWFAPNWWGM